MGLQLLPGTGRQAPPRTRTAATNARLVRQVIEEIWNAGELVLADHLFAPSYVNHGGLVPDLVHGPEAIKFSVALYRTAFPQLQVAVLDLLAQGPLVALRWAAHGTSPPAGERDQATGAATAEPLRGMTFSRLAGGKIMESWTCWETGGAAPFVDPAASPNQSRTEPSR